VVGAGVIGRSWAAVFARAGCPTRVWDIDPEASRRAARWVQEVAGVDASRVSVEDDLAAAVRGAVYVQESGPEQLEVKQALFEELDAAADPDTVLASSTSTHDMTQIAGDIAGASRCVVAHPVNPPHVIPAVEVVPGRATDGRVVDWTCEFLASLGQIPVRMNFFLPGFLLNRLQAALVREAIHLVASGAASVDAVDTVVRDGLGMRWAFLGPFATGHTNADGGLADYYRRYSQSYVDLMESLGPTPSFDEALIDVLAEATSRMVEGRPVADLQRERDRLVGELAAIKQASR
jgi:3-hydroxyacyl-CoA dehydrogenase